MDNKKSVPNANEQRGFLGAGVMALFMSQDCRDSRSGPRSFISPTLGFEPAVLDRHPNTRFALNEAFICPALKRKCEVVEAKNESDYGGVYASLRHASEFRIKQRTKTFLQKAQTCTKLC